MSPLEAFEALACDSYPDLAREVRRRDEPGETVVVVQFLGENAGACAAMWTRPHIGGLVDFETTTGFWRHLEGASAAEIEDAWHAMIRAFLGG
jgi:hypothetical protein